MKSSATEAPAKTLPPKKKRGRPFKVIDEQLLLQLASIQCTYSELAAAFNCDPDTLRDNYSAIIEQGRENGRKSLRRLQFEHAKKSWGMALFLGKIYLNQKEQINDQAQYSKIVAERTAS